MPELNLEVLMTELPLLESTARTSYREASEQVQRYIDTHFESPSLESHAQVIGTYVRSLERQGELLALALIRAADIGRYALETQPRVKAGLRVLMSLLTSVTVETKTEELKNLGTTLTAADIADDFTLTRQNVTTWIDKVKAAMAVHGGRPTELSQPQLILAAKDAWRSRFESFFHGGYTPEAAAHDFYLAAAQVYPFHLLNPFLDRIDLFDWTAVAMDIAEPDTIQQEARINWMSIPALVRLGLGAYFLDARSHITPRRLEELGGAMLPFLKSDREPETAQWLKTQYEASRDQAYWTPPERNVLLVSVPDSPLPHGTGGPPRRAGVLALRPDQLEPERLKHCDKIFSATKRGATRLTLIDNAVGSAIETVEEHFKGKRRDSVVILDWPQARASTGSGHPIISEPRSLEVAIDKAVELLQERRHSASSSGDDELI